MPAGAVPTPPRRARRRRLRAAGIALVAAGSAAAVVFCSAPALAAPSPSRAATLRAGAGADRAALEAARRFLCPHGGTPLRGGRCRGRGATAAVAGVAGRDLPVRDWDAGLPAAGRRQAPCPEGTVSARPLFWNDAVRCVPR